MDKCVFLDRDGILNRELGRHVTTLGEFEVVAGVPEGLGKLKNAGYLLIVVTNQSGIARGYYGEQLVLDCHQILQKSCSDVLDALYFAPGLDSVSRSLSRKPDSLMFEKAIAKFHIDPAQSWMIGDKERDLIPAKRLGIRTIHQTGGRKSPFGDFLASDFAGAIDVVLDTF